MKAKTKRVLYTLFVFLIVLFLVAVLWNRLRNRDGFENNDRLNSKESILIILSTNEMYPEFKPQVETLRKYIEHLSKTYRVDLAGISSKDDFSNYSDVLDFKYKYVNPKLQVSKMCDFVSENRDTLKYDWYLKTRPEVEMMDFDTIDFKNLPKDAVSARAREYTGPFQGKHSCSVGGEGSFSHIKACFFNKEQQKLSIDDNVYVFHKTTVDNGGFSQITEGELPRPGEEGEHEWYFSRVLTARGINLNIIGIDMLFTRKSRGESIYSGNVV
jgi:hypothetical protein